MVKLTVALKRQDAASTAAWVLGRPLIRNTLRAAIRVADTEREEVEKYDLLYTSLIIFLLYS